MWFQLNAPRADDERPFLPQAERDRPACSRQIAPLQGVATAGTGGLQAKKKRAAWAARLCF